MRHRIFELRDLKYRDFHARLMPTVDKDKIIGVRVPQIRKLAKGVFGTSEAEEFLKKLPHDYYEENNLHAFLVERIKDFDRALEEAEKFLPYIDNWATCDMFYPKVFKKNEERLLPKIKEWIKSGHVYTVRYAIVLLMRMDFSKENMDMVANVRSEEYYINMAIAWYFATALSLNYEEAVIYLKENRLDVWVHSKTIQKAIESYRIDDDVKQKLKLMRI